ncbi:MAG: Spy/CpxP family protein refolding chaperone [Reyranellaceae bacterium]
MRAKLPWILLAISLVLNACAVAGFFYAKSRADGRMWDRSPVGAAARSLDLNEQQKAALEKMHQDIRRSSGESRAEMRPLRQQMLEQFAKPQPDFAAIDSDIDQLGDLQSKRYKAMVRAIHEFQQTLTPQQREKFIQGMRDHMQRRMMQRGRRGEGDAPPRPPR